MRGEGFSRVSAPTRELRGVKYKRYEPLNVSQLIIQPSVAETLKAGEEKIVHIKCSDPSLLEAAGIQIWYKSHYSQISTCKVTQSKIDALRTLVATSTSTDVEVYEDTEVHIL